MPRDANGTYTLPIAPFQPLTLAKSAEMNTALTDIADALTDSWSRAIPTPAQGDLNMNGHNILNLGEVVGTLTASGGVWANNQPGTFGFNFNGTNYVWFLGSSDFYDWLRSSDGLRSWHAAGADVMTLDPGGNLHATGAISAGGAISTPSNISASGNAGIGGTVTANVVTANAITSNGALSVAGNATVGGTVTANVVTANAITSNGALSVAGNANVNGTLNAGTVVTTGDATVGLDLGVGRDLGVSRNAIITGTVTANIVSANGITSSGTVTAANATVSGAVTAGTVSASGSVTAGGFLSGQYLAGGEGDAGALNCFGGANRATFRWADRGGSSWLGYRIDGAVEYIICTSVNAQSLQMATGGGGPTNTFLAVNDHAGNAYYIQADVLSDARIKHSIAPTRIDALAALSQINVAEFFVRADAVAAIQPVSPEAKAKLRDQPDPFQPIGLVAQQVRPFLPEMVTIQSQPEGHDPALPEDLLGLHLAAAVPYLIRAVQQLAERVAELEAAAP